MSLRARDDTGRARFSELLRRSALDDGIYLRSHFVIASCRVAVRTEVWHELCLAKL